MADGGRVGERRGSRHRQSLFSLSRKRRKKTNLAQHELVDENIQQVPHAVLVVRAVDDVTLGGVVEGRLGAELATEELGRICGKTGWSALVVRGREGERWNEQDEGRPRARATSAMLGKTEEGKKGNETRNEVNLRGSRG